MNQLNRMLLAGRFHEVARAGEAALAAHPADPDLHLLLGRALVEVGRPGEALSHLDFVVRLDTRRSWRWAWAQDYRARALYCLGRTADAHAALDDAIASNATRNVVRDARGLAHMIGYDATFDGWREFRLGDVRVHYGTAVTRDQARAFAASRAAALEQLREWIPVKPLKPIDIFVWPDAGSARAAGFRSIGFARPELGLIHSRLDQTPAHELVHVVVFQGLDSVHRTRFVNEGVAVLMDGTGRSRLAMARLAVARLDGPVHIVDLWRDGQRAPEPVVYPVAAAFLERLRERGGEDRFKEFHRDQTVDRARELNGPLLDRVVESVERDLSASARDPGG
ncbi:MAG: hypothetical protein P8174_03990 [Gemmatimonadota bacterium]